MRQQHGDEAYRLTIVASRATYIYGPYALLSSARALRTRQKKWVLSTGQTIISDDIERATEWTKVED